MPAWADGCPDITGPMRCCGRWRSGGAAADACSSDFASGWHPAGPCRYAGAAIPADRLPEIGDCRSGTGGRGVECVGRPSPCLNLAVARTPHSVTPPAVDRLENLGDGQPRTVSVAGRQVRVVFEKSERHPTTSRFATPSSLACGLHPRPHIRNRITAHWAIHDKLAAARFLRGYVIYFSPKPIACSTR